MFRRFKRRFDYLNEEGEKITIPFGWAGELDADVAAKADEANATVRDPRAAKESDDPSIDAMTVDDLKAYAEEYGIDLGDATKKADILVKVKAAS